jgi:dihydroxyacetone kinase-like predicted kinase
MAEKKLLIVRLIEIMKNNNIDNLDLNDGEITYVQKKVKKKLLTILSSFFDGDNDRVNEVIKYDADNRELVTIESIVRKVHATDSGSKN